MGWDAFLNNLLRELRLSPYELSKIAKIGHSNIMRVLRGQTKRPFPNTIHKIEQALNISIDDSNINNITYKKLPPKNEHDINKIIYSNNRGYPLLAHINSLSPENLFNDENVIGQVAFTYKKEERCFFVKAEGDSMHPTISDGDYVFVDMDEPIHNNNIIITILRDGRQLIKRYKKISDDLALLYSDNYKYEPFPVQLKDILLSYRVVKIIKNNI
ncbi:S24 family peptidase [Melioribacter sp. OK-6-Me]|uniref:S24 family peptidase n=1 Tax=unclassified Melioribacter TaxID=2627329 RepID=UPI003ED8861D